MDASHPIAPSPGEMFRVLVVEDDWNIARLIMIHMEQAGFECRHAPDGEIALEVFESHKPHIVLLDVMLPRLSGRDVCARIRQTSTVPIIMLTALDTPEDEVTGFKLGADDYVPKPFNPKLLVARVISWLRRVYRYDFPNEPTPSVPEKKDNLSSAGRSVPSGWASCEACAYIGPREKFDSTNALGNKVKMCPNCKQGEFVVFSL